MAEPEMEDPTDPDPAPETGEAEEPSADPMAEEAPAEADEPEEAEPSPDVEPAPAEEEPPARADPAPADQAPPQEPAAPPEGPEPTRGDPDEAAGPADGPEEPVVTVDDDLAGGQPPAPQGPPPEELEASLNDLAETLTHLSKSIEEIKAFRDEMEARLSDVEERMVRLGSLAEAVSMQYNPFLEEDGDAPTPSGDGRRLGDGDQPTTRPDPAAPREDPSDTEPGEANPSTGEPATRRSPRSGDTLERRMLVMEWVKFLIERVGRVRLLDLLEYYEELGWLDAETKETVMQVAVGVDGPDRVEDADWKGDRELHERSLIALERLRGREVTGQTLDSLHLDLDRIFGG